MVSVSVNWSVSVSESNLLSEFFRVLFRITITMFGAYLKLRFAPRRSSYVSLSVSYDRSLERGGMSELSLAQADR